MGGYLLAQYLVPSFHLFYNLKNKLLTIILVVLVHVNENSIKIVAFRGFLIVTLAILLRYGSAFSYFNPTHNYTVESSVLPISTALLSSLRRHLLHFYKDCLEGITAFARYDRVLVLTILRFHITKYKRICKI